MNIGDIVLGIGITGSITAGVFAIAYVGASLATWQEDHVPAALAFRPWRLRAAGNQGEIMSTDIISITVGPDDRDRILLYAKRLLDPGDRGPNAVIAMAGPLLEWAAEATDEDDLHSRMQAMSHTYLNEGDRLRASLCPVPARLTPHDFLAAAGAYYAFITATTAP